MKILAFCLLCSLTAFAGVTPGNADNVRRAGDTMAGTLDMGSNALLNAYRITITGPTSTYSTTFAMSGAVSAMGLSTNTGGSLATNDAAAVWVASVRLATNIGGAWYVGPAVSSSYTVAVAGATNEYDVIVNWTNTAGYTYWVSLTNSADAWPELWTNVNAGPFTFEAAADYDVPFAGRTFLVTTNEPAMALTIGGDTDAQQNRISNAALVSASVVVADAKVEAYRAVITGPTNTYSVTTVAWPAGAAVGSATNITGTLANDTDVFAFVAHVWPATNIGGAWLFGPAISNVYAGDGSGETNDLDLVVSWTNYPGMAYWLALTNAALAGAEIYTNVSASPFTFAGVADYDAALDTSRTLYVVTNATDTALVIGGTVNMGGNAITNLASPTVASGAANKAYVDAAVGQMPRTYVLNITPYRAYGGSVSMLSPLDIAPGGLRNLVWTAYFYDVPAVTGAVAVYVKAALNGPVGAIHKYTNLSAHYTIGSSPASVAFVAATWAYTNSIAGTEHYVMTNSVAIPAGACAVSFRIDGETAAAGSQTGMVERVIIAY